MWATNTYNYYLEQIKSFLPPWSLIIHYQRQAYKITDFIFIIHQTFCSYVLATSCSHATVPFCTEATSIQPPGGPGSSLQQGQALMQHLTSLSPYFICPKCGNGKGQKGELRMERLPPNWRLRENQDEYSKHKIKEQSINHEGNLGSTLILPTTPYFQFDSGLSNGLFYYLIYISHLYFWNSSQRMQCSRLLFSPQAHTCEGTWADRLSNHLPCLKED